MPDQKAPPDPTPGQLEPSEEPKKSDTCAFCLHPVDIHNRFASEPGAGQCEDCACRGVVLTG